MGPAHQTKERTRAGRRSMPLRIAIEVAALGAVAYFFLRERHQFAGLGAIVAGGGAAPVLLPILSVVLAGSVGAAILFRRPDLLVRSFDWIEGHLRGRLGRWICEATRQVRDSLGSLTGVRPSIRTWVAAAALSALNWMLDVICLALSFQAVGGPIPWGVVLL